MGLEQPRLLLGVSVQEGAWVRFWFILQVLPPDNMMNVLVSRSSCRCTFTQTHGLCLPSLLWVFELMLFAAFWRKSLFSPCIKTCGYDSISQQATTGPAWVLRDGWVLFTKESNTSVPRKCYVCALRWLECLSPRCLRARGQIAVQQVITCSGWFAFWISAIRLCCKTINQNQSRVCCHVVVQYQMSRES